MKKNYVIEDMELSCDSDRSFRLDSYGHDKKELLDNATIAEIDEDGTELTCYGFGEAAEWMQEKVATAVNKELKREQDL